MHVLDKVASGHYHESIVKGEKDNGFQIGDDHHRCVIDRYDLKIPEILVNGQSFGTNCIAAFM